MSSPRASLGISSVRPLTPSSSPLLGMPRTSPCLLQSVTPVRTAVRVSASSESNAASAENVVMNYAKLGLSLSAFVATDACLKSFFASMHWTFPAPLAGMFIIMAILAAVGAVGGDAAVDKVNTAFSPALDWVAKWLPLFYVPSLITLPLNIGGIPGGDMVKILLIIAGGMVASLYVTAQAAVTIRSAVNTELQPPAPAKAPAPYTRNHLLAWSGTAVAALLLAAMSSGEALYYASTAFMLAVTVIGLLLGSAIPANIKAVLHPVITCAATAQIGSLALAAATADSAPHVLKMFLTKGVGAMGAGDILMSFLGTVILSFGFRVFAQRDLMKRHAAEIFGACIISALFSLFGTALAAKAIGLSPDLVKALTPRSVTIALALPIAAQLETTQPAVTAAAVVLTGLLGANFVQVLLSKFGFQDPIARGLATAGAAHGLGTAALAAKEPNALPFCALSYALIGIISTLLVCVPVVREALIAIAGV